MQSKSIVPVILCGGIGTRLWPLSRKSFPKQFLSLDPNEEKSLLQKTQERINPISNLKNPILICNEDHRFIVAEQFREIKIQPKKIILEPFGRNTAPAITLAALASLENEDDPHLLVLSSDHEIKNNVKFLEVIEEGIKYSSNGRLVTFGIVPQSPETGYGYIKSKKEFNNSTIEGFNIESFVEKPNKETASQFIKDKRYTWNSGMFLFKAKLVLNEIEKSNPDIIEHCKKALKKGVEDLDFFRIDAKEFYECPNLSIDIAVMEKTTQGTVIPLDVGWSDIGSWDSVWKISKKDKNGNVTQGNIFEKNIKDCYIRGDKRLIAAIGVKNLIIVETGDAILIADKTQSQEVKDIVNSLTERGISEGQDHKKIYRPWGYYESVVDDIRWQVKLINVKPGEKLSLQLHHYRSEHWVVVDGTAKVEIGSKVTTLHENQSCYIPSGEKHRLSNPGEIPLKLIEIQSGSYLGEDDIERFEDNYGRIS